MCESNLGETPIQLNTGLDPQRESGNCTLFQNNYMEARFILFYFTFFPGTSLLNYIMWSPNLQTVVHILQALLGLLICYRGVNFEVVVVQG